VTFSVRRSGHGRIVASSDNGFRSRALSPLGQPEAPEVYAITLAPGCMEEAEAHAPGTYEHLVVTSGTLVVSTGSDATTLEAGRRALLPRRRRASLRESRIGPDERPSRHELRAADLAAFETANPPREAPHRRNAPLTRPLEARRCSKEECRMFFNWGFGEKRWAVALVTAAIVAGVTGSSAAKQPSREELEDRVRRLEQIIRDAGLDQPPAKRKKAATRTTTERESVTTKSEPGLDKEQVDALVDEKLRKQKVLAGWKDGFFLESPNGDFKLKLRGYMQTDARVFPLEEGDTGTDTIYMRRIRPIFEGHGLQVLRLPLHAGLRQRRDRGAGCVGAHQLLPVGTGPGRQVQVADVARTSPERIGAHVHRALDLERQHRAQP
jgi:hypothetical protein